MSAYLAVPLLLILAVVQSAVLPKLPLLGIMPDPMLLVVMCWSLYRGPNEGMLWGFGGGLLLDFLSGTPVGTHALALMLVGFVSGLGQRQVLRGHYTLPLVTSVGVTILYHLVILAVLTATGYDVDWVYSLVRVTLPAMVLHVLLAAPVFRVMGGLDALIRRPEVHLG